MIVILVPKTSPGNIIHGIKPLKETLLIAEEFIPITSKKE
ncbi:Uncharacterized protein dnm_060900 [Desulfonema magnum]|uniref:Uncharacterized protein n=1 Tax=Desulfonema magnum TaxID=45655 RepID=A0A975GQL5_9BACT|nr:Uncharacterized protein dnm_060900 [Desulfonema magnum]